MGKCPICKVEPPQETHKPFCSKRCADIDLHRWLGGTYAIPAVEPPDDFDAEMEAPCTRSTHRTKFTDGI